MQASAQAADVEAIRQSLKRQLPDYMVPGRFMVLEELPLNANGKVDRARLPAPPTESTEGEAPQVALSPTEELLAGLWCDSLKIEAVGRDDNFFELGGHSLLATQLVSRIQTVFHSRLPLDAVFSAPTLREMAAQIDAGLHGELIEIPFERADRARPLPLSFAQERLWFLSQLEPENPFYNTPFALRLSGELNETALRAALQDLVARHEVLRTAFRNDGGSPHQEVIEELLVPVVKVDLSELPAEEREASLLARARDEAREPFRDLASPPLVRAVLLKLREDEHALLLTLHHIVTDGWSLNILLREFTHSYNARAAGGSPELPPLPIQYADFAAWQRRWLTGDILERQLDYWREKLTGAPPMLALPTDYPRPAVQQFRGAVIRFGLDRETRDALHRLGRAHDATLFMTLLGGFAVLLYRYSGQADIMIGTPIANRQRRELEDLLGFFVNTLALRIDLEGQPSFADLLERVREVSLGAYAHQDLPFEKLVDEIHPERDLSRSPLFQVMFALQNMPLEEVDVSGLKLSPLRIQRSAALFDLVLDFWDTSDGLHGVLEYNCDLFEQTRAERLVHHLTTLLKALSARPEASVSTVPLLDEGEVTQLLGFSNGPVVEHPFNQSLAEVFEKQVELTPLRVAATADGEPVDYAGLNERANRVAHLLRELGVEPNAPVGVIVPRGLDYLAAVLGVVKAGGAFLPLDTAYPSERLRYMVEDSGCPVLLATAEGLSRLGAEGLSAELREVVLMSAHGPENTQLPPGVRLSREAELARQPITNPAVVNSPRDILYMLYTSGSTGLPKGTLVRHDGALNHIFAEFGLLEFHEGTAFLQSAPASSDISVWQCLAPLLAGGRVVFADFETMCSPASLFGLIKGEGVTLIELVPVVLEGLLSHASELTEAERALPRLEWCMVTGEAVSVALVNRWFATWPSIPLVNAYGPTEAADDVCQHVMRGPLPESPPTVPIGKPLDNLTISVLDAEGQLVPLGVPGEICVSGIGVGAGYWRQPERTAASFQTNPLPGKTFGDVLYRTGDLGRWRADGTLEFMGRLDHQVKIRGFRVEPGEIEAALRKHPQVREALVLDQQDPQGERQLAAYLQVQISADGSEELVRQQVTLWKDLHEDSYKDTSAAEADPTFNTIGWDSTYTGEPLSAAEMRECVDNAVARILELKPRRLLEIGCGTGLLMYRLVPHCEQYFGTDLSAVAINQLEERKGQLSLPGLARAELREQRADDFKGFDEGSFDTLALNSVIQYFPGVDYLLEVLRKAARRSAPGGSVFVGDVRSLPLLRSYHTSVQCFKAEDTLTRDELLGRIEAQLAREQELAVAPDFFEAVCRHLPRVGGALLRPKRGRAHNEMTRFRYDVTLSIEPLEDIPACPADAFEDWRLSRLDAVAIRAHLSTARPACWGLRRVANARLSSELLTQQWLNESAATATVGELREWLARSSVPAVDPEALWELADALPYRVEIVVEPESTSGEFAVLFTRRDGPALRIELDSNTSAAAPRPWAEYANNPLQEKFGALLIPQLRDFVKSSLPGHMIPSTFVVLDRFPLTPNGKIDRGALPKPTFKATRGGERVAPRTETERAVQAVWAAVLGVDEPGVEDNFFALGGHSLKATQVVSRLQQTRAELSLRDIFNYPTIAELSAFLDRQEAGETLEAIPTVPRAEDYPTSHAQQRLWVLAQVGGGAAYHMADGLRLRGPLAPGALGAAFDALIERHETLRTSFAEVDGELRQRVADAVEHSLQVFDLSEHADPLAAARGLALEHARAGFDLSRAPLLRVSLLKLGADEHVLLFNVHHIVSDGWSMDILVREFMLLYEAAVAEGPNPLPPLRIQHRDYVAWQHKRAALYSEAQRDYWLRQLRDTPPLELPTDFPRPPLKTYNGGSVRLLLHAEVLDEINALARKQNVTLFMLLAALVKVLLYRYSGETEISLGCPVAGREHPDLENQVGFFINTLVLRDRIEGTQAFTAFLREVRETALAAYARQDYPFDQLVKELNPPRDAGRNPLFDVMLVLQNTANVAVRLPEIEIEPLRLDYGQTQFDLLWNFAEAADGLHLELKYNSDLFRRESVERMLESWQAVIAGAVAEPETPLGRLPLLKPAERAAVLDVRPEQPESQAAYSSLVEWFEAQAAATPQAVAVTDEERRLTYAELNARANRVARGVRRRLEDVGAVGEALVGLCVHRSAELVVGLLGILKAGAAYLPLDPDAPAARLRFILRDARVPLLVTQEGVLNLPDEELPGQYRLDAGAEVGEDEARNLELPLCPEAAAYVIYTSGSTGEPKGAVITHGNVLRLFTSTRGWFDFGPADVWTLFHSFAFDFSVWEIWGALLHGGRLVVVPYLVSRAPEQFHELLSREAVTVLNQTPSAFRQLMQAEAARTEPLPLALRYVIFGGEALDPSRLRTWFERHGDQQPQLVNMYGITETTVHVTYRALTRRDAEQSASLIGEPIPDLYLYVLDEWLEPVPAGVPGELYVGGAGLARGYLFREELTALRFIPDPFRPGQRLYRTGDRVRRTHEGELEYLGRLDTQIKIRGFRIEVGEITSALGKHPSVREAAISLRQRDGDPCLVAYYVASNGGVESADLRRHLQESLPAYMIPNFFIPLPRLPLTVNGKLDQRALPEPEEAAVAAGNGHGHGNGGGRAPRTPLEGAALEVWRKALGHGLLGPDDNVFEHGAHSVLVIQARNELQKLLKRDIPVVMLFQYPTVAALAAQLDGDVVKPSDGGEPEVQRRASQRRDAARRRATLRQTDPKREP
ncbi:MAG TPA: amino acid adenylation domain-containing protein [Pyrinomonadaceae bacterium]|nr:amino acid adenylation domain-containing protein [Pyrinomonadaceae bacterium]